MVFIKGRQKYVSYKSNKSACASIYRRLERRGFVGYSRVTSEGLMWSIAGNGLRKNNMSNRDVDYFWMTGTRSTREGICY